MSSLQQEWSHFPHLQLIDMLLPIFGLLFVPGKLCYVLLTVLYGDIWEDFIQSWSPSFFHSFLSFVSDFQSIHKADQSMFQHFTHKMLGEESKITNITRGKEKHYSKNCMESFYYFHKEENL